MAKSGLPADLAGKSTFQRRLPLLLLVLALAALVYWQFGDLIGFDNLAQRETQLRDFQQQHPWLVYFVAFLIYVGITGLSLPGAAILTVLFGWYFGVVTGVIMVSISSTTGATIAFLLSRYFFRDSIRQRFGNRLASFNEALSREGPWVLFTMRLVPAVPFFVINAVMGLTPIRVVTFWWVSLLGMLPGTTAYVYAGSSVPSLATLADQGINAVFTPAQLSRITFAFVLLGLLPLLTRWSINAINRYRSQSSRSAD